MKVFNARHFLRHIAASSLREFVQAHVLAPRLVVDWFGPADTLSRHSATLLKHWSISLPPPISRSATAKRWSTHLLLWTDDLRRAHLMANGLAVAEFRSACQDDPEALGAFASRDEREIALWMLAFRDKIFRDVELHLAFQAKTDGKFWKKHRIQPGLELTRERARLEQFCHAVAQLYKKSGGGDGVHIELSERRSTAGLVDAMSSFQLTLYVEGPVTALSHFTQSHFTRVTTRVALESALVYQPATGEVETIVKGGAKNHAAMLELFGKHVVQQDLAPERIEPQRYHLNALRDGLQPYEDWSVYGVDRVRLRRARLTPAAGSGVSFTVEASPDRDQDDAIRIARGALKVEHMFDAEYHLDAATVIVYMQAADGGRAGHFSFNIRASGASTIKNLSLRNQVLARKVLQALMVIDAEEDFASAVSIPREAIAA
ncbi:glycine hydroxymethyltransferase [Ralstonia pseudosolanacearum]|uniref:glycine hydroxymethyltransferase n=1 Tax=Ralstonia pseudosolanacearum TaxID=1310165 RepID=UPI001E38199C|nr:glycine hydroxymethyltransferase [Ralstonia pseudosolanacearum]